MKCLQCDEDLPNNKDHVKCHQCKQKMHYQCAGISSSTWKSKSQKAKLDWKCKQCRSQGKHPTSLNSSTDIPDDLTCSSLRKILEEMFQKQEKIFTEKIEAMSTTIAQYQADLNTANDKIKNLEKYTNALKEEIDALKVTSECEKQYARSKNIIIMGIPTQKEENITQEVMKLTTAMGAPLKKEEITVHRLPSKDETSPPPIILQCKSRATRDLVVRTARKIKPKLPMIQEGAPVKPIYFNDHLTPYFTQLMIKAKSLQRDRKFKFLWLDGNRIMLKKDEKSTPYRITKDSDFDEIAQAHPPVASQ